MARDAAGDGGAQTGFATVVITCCNRPHELDRTLGSIMACDLTGVAGFVVIEDSDCADTRAVVARHLAGFAHTFIQNDRNLGQIRSVDRAYREVTTPYVFHCEEDWLFPSSLFLDEARRLLEHDASIHAVMLRARDEWPRKIFDVPEKVLDGIGYYPTDPKSHRRWGSFSFNPGLRRMSDYRAFGPYVDIGPERDISFAHKLRGFRLASLSDGDMRHIGHNPTTKVDEIKRRKGRGYLWKSLKHRVQFAWYRLTG